MSYNYFNPATMNDLAKFQGAFAGYQAGNAPYIGVAQAPTSIYNQAGFYAIQDPNTGYVSLQRLGGESLYTQQWYDQSTGINFNFTPGGTTTFPNQESESESETKEKTASVASYPQFTGASPYVQQTGATSPFNINIQITGGAQGTQTQYPTTQQQQYPGYNTGIMFTGGAYPQQGVQNANYSQYPWGAGTVVVNNDYASGYNAGYQAAQQENGVQTTESTENTAQPQIAKDPAKELKAEDLQEMVDCGIYENTEEAFNALQKQGYWLSDKEQSELGLYNEADEEKIQMLMDKLGCTRGEAIKQLGDKIQTSNTKNDKNALEEKIGSMMNNGLSRKEAVEYLEELGYEVPDELKKSPAKYSEEDEMKINAVMEATGCSREEAIKATGAKPKENFFAKISRFYAMSTVDTTKATCDYLL